MIQKAKLVTTLGSSAWFLFCSIDQRSSTFLTANGQSFKDNIHKVPKNITSTSAVITNLFCFSGYATNYFQILSFLLSGRFPTFSYII